MIIPKLKKIRGKYRSCPRLCLREARHSRTNSRLKIPASQELQRKELKPLKNTKFNGRTSSQLHLDGDGEWRDDENAKRDGHILVLTTSRMFITTCDHYNWTNGDTVMAVRMMMMMVMVVVLVVVVVMVIGIVMMMGMVMVMEKRRRSHG